MIFGWVGYSNVEVEVGDCEGDEVDIWYWVVMVVINDLVFENGSLGFLVG